MTINYKMQERKEKREATPLKVLKLYTVSTLYTLYTFVVQPIISRLYLESVSWQPGSYLKWHCVTLGFWFDTPLHPADTCLFYHLKLLV